jgi:hypothetical protein
MRIHFVFLTLLFGVVSLAHADVIIEFNVNTASISGTAGSLDFEFNPGPLVSQPASLELLNFGGDGVLAGAPSLTGDVSGGPLPANVTFDNLTVFNDYFEGFTFGSSLLFEVRLYGPAVNSPDGTSTSGSAFVFSMFSDPAGTSPVLTSDTTDGFAALANVNLNGTVSVTDFSSETAASAVPEPGTFGLLAIGILMAAARRRSVR